MVQYYHMFDFHEKRKIRSVIYSKYSIGVIILVGLLISSSMYERLTVEREMATKLEARNAELVELKNRAATLEAKVDHLNDDRGIEEEIRGRFDVAKEGEQVVIILDDNEATATPDGEGSKFSRESEGEESIFGWLKFW